MRKGKTGCFDKEFYGTTTIGERGQMVIPAEARRKYNLNPGDKMMVFGINGTVACAKFEDVEKIANEMSEKLAGLRALLKK